MDPQKIDTREAKAKFEIRQLAGKMSFLLL